MDQKGAKTAFQMIEENPMTLTKTLTLMTLTAVLAGAVSTLAHAEGMEGRDHGPMPMLNFETVDSNKDGKITQEEWGAFRTAEFAKTDSNADGQLSGEELTARRVADMTARASEMAAKMIARMDGNGDGQLSAEELAQGPRPMDMFERADSDGDGAVSKAEAEALHEKMGKFRKMHRKG